MTQESKDFDCICEEVPIKTIHTEGKGGLSFFEVGREIDFDVKRIYYIHNVPENVERGGHAHIQLRQFLFCPFGSIQVLLDNGKEKWSVILDNPNKGLYLAPHLWHDMKWLKENSILCVAASDCYNESDYIRNYDDYLRFLSNKG